MSEKGSVSMPKCTSCNRIIAPGAESSKFSCPDCGEIVIWRCTKCREFRRPYRCPKCGFQGP